jgi:hypothetical protein
MQMNSRRESKREGFLESEDTPVAKKRNTTTKRGKSKAGQEHCIKTGEI